MARTFIAVSAAIVVVAAVSIPIITYLSHLEEQGAVRWPNWLAKTIVILMIGCVLWLTAFGLKLMARRWPEE